MKRKTTYSEKYQKGMVTFEKETCLKFIKACDSIQAIEAGKNDDGTEYQILRIDGINVDKL
jgi:hypothetical protein